MNSFHQVAVEIETTTCCSNQNTFISRVIWLFLKMLHADPWEGEL